MEENKYGHFVRITAAGIVGDAHDSHLYIPSWQHQHMFIRQSSSASHLQLIGGGM